ncbi:peptidase M1 [Microbulbifer flavimaris]|uniref:Aminopeptidase n=1 Tax=Microbulbifer flavimaris TaxID=1781068 RepID=A0ABX4I0L9_9GAMM|nr:MULTISPECIES: M1 family metallopeptidase [Microbulbifer]KUJ83706.1 peptidase M1 [Microbulbifer sp. ZGT114]PCO05876.1 peptidase M1 [Microbulbifer flavimaris]
MKHTALRSLLALPLAALLACSPAEDANKPSSNEEMQTATEVPETAEAEAPERAAGIPDEAPAGRLPEGVTPTAYRLDLLIDPREDDFSGSVAIDIDLDFDAKHVWLHGKNLQVSAVTAVLEDGKTVDGQYSEVLESGVARVSFAEPLPEGAFTLRMDYSAPFDRNLAGLFKVEEQGNAYALAKSESIQARKYLPGFDEPGLKAPFDITLTVPQGYAAISNGAEIKREPAGEGLEKVTFATTRPTPTYLLSLSVGPFDMVERAAIPPSQYRTKPIPLRGFARKGRGQDMSYILDITPRMVEIFENELKRPYPFEKLDIIAAPQWPSGATELSAAITYREQRILVGNDPAPGARLALLQIHAHEIAHMWFGNLVTPPWWDDLWLKEGFSTWGTPLALTIMEPEGGHELNAAEEAISAMQLDSLASTRAIREPIEDNNEIRNAYDAITYDKSLGVIHMVDQYFRPEKFRPALGRYIETFADGVANSEDFYRVIGEETNTPELTETFRSFVEQKGVPQLDVTLECGNGAAQVNIKQQRYKPLGSPIESVATKWTIPVCLRSDAGRQCVMMEEAEQTLAISGGICPEWLLPNAKGSGYYRWTLSPEQWQSLLATFDELTPTEAMSVIDSAFAAFEAGTLPEATLIEVMRKSANSDRRQVVSAPLGHLEKYRRNYVDDEQQQAFLDFLQSLYQPVLQRTEGSDDNDEKLLHSELQSFMALTGDDPDTRKALTDKAIAFTGFKGEQDKAALDSDLYEAALTVAVQDAGADFLPHLVKIRSEIDDPRFENASANAIGGSNDPEQLEQIHELALGDAIGPRETFGLLLHALAQPAVKDQHWQWLQSNFPTIVKKIPAQWRRRTPGFARAFCEPEKLQQLQQLFETHGAQTPGYRRSLDQTGEQIQLCIALKDRGKALVNALAQ